MVAAGFAVIAWATGNVNFAAYLHIPYIPYTSELVVVCTVISKRPNRRYKAFPAKMLATTSPMHKQSKVSTTKR